jgi:magnesium transporter
MTLRDRERRLVDGLRDRERKLVDGLRQVASHRPLVGRVVRRVHKPAGSAPGTLLHAGEKKIEKVRIRYIDYDQEALREQTVDDIEACFGPVDDDTVTWVNIDGLHEPEVVASVGDRFQIHRLVMEDVLSPTQRPKVEDYGEYFFVVVRMLGFEKESETITSEQVSLIVGDRYVFSFQERFGDVFEPVRERLREGKGRLRSRGPDYLAYALIDAIVDSYFRILEEVGDHLEDMEESVLRDPSLPVMHRLHHLKREMLILRRAVWPLREVLGSLYRGEVRLVTEETRVFLRDVYDHAVNVIDTVETLREVNSSAIDLYMSHVGNRMNEVMKVLTIIATIFIPLSFFAGVYGMNFEYMPELAVRWAYPALLAWMLLIAGGMLLYFRKKGWL